MSNILDRVFLEISLDERITDGIFRMDEAAHMDALRDYFVRKGITKEASIHVTNRMIEGKYPLRQVYNKDGILCTFPTPQHKQRAIARGTHSEKNPVPQVQQQRDAAKEEEPKQAPPGSKPEPGELPPDDDEDEKDTDKDEDEEGGDKGGGHGGGMGGGSGGGSKEPTIFQGDKQSAVEPPRGEERPEPPPVPPSPTVPPSPRTPERVAAEKEVTKQILGTDDTKLSNIADPLSENIMRHQLRELYKKADEWGFREAVKFLTPHVKP